VNTLPNEEPLWFAPAYNYLKQCALGDAWIHLVERWAQHECAKRWKSGKVCIYSFPLRHKLTSRQSRASPPKADQKNGTTGLPKLGTVSVITAMSLPLKMPPISELQSQPGLARSQPQISAEQVPTAQSYCSC
jgi:hypothetical protein